MSIFITGTDTDVGKTVTTATLAAIFQEAGFKVGVYKPIQSGALDENGELKSPDLNVVKLFNKDVITKSSYLLKAAVAPTTAAEEEGVNVDKDKLFEDYRELNAKCDIVFVEGAGGFLAPFFKDYLVRDVVRFLNLPLIIVARPDLGTINHALMTIEAAKSNNIKVLGVVISKYPENTDDLAVKTAPDMIHKFSGEKIIGLIPDVEGDLTDTKNIELLKAKARKSLDIEYLTEFIKANSKA